MESIEGCYTAFLGAVNSLVDEFVPSRPTDHNPKWTLPPPRSLDRRKRAAWKTYKRVRAELGRRHVDAAAALQWFATLNQQYRNFHIRQQVDHEANLVANLSSCPKAFYSYIRRKKNGSPPIGPLKVDGRIVSDFLGISEVLAAEFSSHYRVGTLGPISGYQS